MQCKLLNSNISPGRHPRPDRGDSPAGPRVPRHEVRADPVHEERGLHPRARGPQPHQHREREHGDQG